MPNMTRQQRRYNKNPLRRKIPGVGAQNRPTVRTPIRVVGANGTAMSTLVEVTFDGPVNYTGIVPGWTEDSLPATVVSAVQVSPTQINMTWSVAIGPGLDLFIPFEDPSIRNSAGGYVRDITVGTT